MALSGSESPEMGGAGQNLTPRPHEVRKNQTSSGVDLVLAAGGLDFNLARTTVTVLKARERHLKIAERRKELVPLAAVKDHVSKAFIGYRQAMERMPARWASQIAATLGCAPDGSGGGGPLNARRAIGVVRA